MEQASSNSAIILLCFCRPTALRLGISPTSWEVASRSTPMLNEVSLSRALYLCMAILVRDCGISFRSRKLALFKNSFLKPVRAHRRAGHGFPVHSQENPAIPLFSRDPEMQKPCAPRKAPCNLHVDVWSGGYGPLRPMQMRRHAGLGCLRGFVDLQESLNETINGPHDGRHPCRRPRPHRNCTSTGHQQKQVKAPASMPSTALRCGNTKGVVSRQTQRSTNTSQTPQSEASGLRKL